MHIAYETQRLSLRFFLLMLVLFCVQVALGLILAAQQADPSLLAGYMNFNVARAGHLFYGVLWILCGFIGATIFVAPMLAKRDLVAPWRSEERRVGKECRSRWSAWRAKTNEDGTSRSDGK